jgi:Zn-dependent M28 family amino/carboxypeptidase
MRLQRFLVGISPLLLAAFGVVSCVTQPLVQRIESREVTVDATALERHVRTLAVTLHPRSVDNLPNLERAADYVLEQLRSTGAETAEQIVEADGKQFRNLIARFGPRDGPLIVIGAHYDSCGDTPGADDNASGVAGLLELARLLAQHPPKHSVELVAFTLEEPPYFRTDSMGSVWHARELRRTNREVRLMLSLEMIGFYSDAPKSQAYPVAALKLLYPDRADFIAIVAPLGDFSDTRRVKGLFQGASDLPVVSINAPPTLQGVDFSDHASYWRFGMPAMMITDTSFFRNRNYHESGDTPETLDYARMAKVVRAVHAVAMEF